jgi:hypothetical protein
MLPEKRVVRLTARQIRTAENLPGVVKRRRFSIITSKRAQICKHSVVPKKWVIYQVAREVRLANDLTSTVDVIRET